MKFCKIFLRRVAVLGVFLASSVQLAAQDTSALTPEPQNTPSSPTASAPPAKTWSADRILEEAQRAEEHAEEQVSLISGLMQTFVAVLGVALIILLGAGLHEWKIVRDKADRVLKEAERVVSEAKEKADLIVKQAGDAARQIQEASEETRKQAESTLTETQGHLARIAEYRVEIEAALQLATGAAEAVGGMKARIAEYRIEIEAALQLAMSAAEAVGGMKKSLVEAWGEIDKTHEGLPALEAEWGPISKPQAFRPEVRAFLEDQDVLLMVADRLKIPADSGKSAESFLWLSKYWRFLQDFPRSLVRVKRALDLDPKIATRGRLQLARTLSQWAASEHESAFRMERLQNALNELEALRKLQGDTAAVLFEIAWALDEMGRFEEAIDYFSKAREKSKSEGENSSEKWSYTYNLACSLAKAGRDQEALRELKALIGQGSEWIQSAAQDTDFEGLRDSEQWGKQFEATLQEARQASGSSG